MKFSYQWLSDLVDGLPAPSEVTRLITLHTAECEGFEEAGALMDKACPARVLSVEPLSGHNQKAIVETTSYGQKTVVCGAPNCRPGLWTVYAPIGKKLIAGIESEGMLASPQELGINRDHSGVIELTGPNFPFKTDHVIEVDNKSLTHRPDLWGHYGMAREVAGILNHKLIDPVKAQLPSGEALYKVSIEDFNLCPRFSGLVFDNVTVQPSPMWLQYRLEAIGLNPINNIVDVTNFIMSELAQPMHAYDAEKLHGSTIYVRNAKHNEKLLALNKETYELDPSNLVIADAEAAIGLAGVIGGNASAIGATTKRIFLEAACFSATSVRKTAAKIKNRTDASMRFEKSQDPENTTRSLRRAIELLKEVSPGIELAGGTTDLYQKPAPPAPIELPLEWLNRKLGISPTPERVKTILQALEFGVTESKPGVLTVTVPTWRATKDISIKDDLVEEIGRMIGYGNITPTAPRIEAKVPPATPERAYQHYLRDLTAAQGFTEAYNYSFLSDAAVEEFGWNPATHIRVLNPIASDQALMRTSLLPGILRNLRDNRKHSETFRLFEIGKEVHKQPAGLPIETPHLTAAIFSKDDGSAALFELKRLAECLAPGATAHPVVATNYEHPARSAEIRHGSTVLGRLFEFHPRYLESGRGAVLDIDLHKLEAVAEGRSQKYQPIRRYPTSWSDLTFEVGLKTLVGDVESTLKNAPEVPNLISVEFLRQYLKENTKSLSFRFTFGLKDRTLTPEEVKSSRDAIIGHLKSQGYTIPA